MKVINVKGKNINFVSKNNTEFISLTDIARYKNPKESKDIIKNWLRNKSTIEFLGLWERINNPLFKGVEFDSFLREAGANSFVLSPKKWIEKTDAIGLISKPGKGGGTFTHIDIALEFASWISAEFKLYLIKEIQRLKSEEKKRRNLGWDVKRELAKINYKIHTDAIKNYLIPPIVSKSDTNMIYATEADILNKALFGLTAKEWTKLNPDKKENMRDCAETIQLIVLANLEVLNSEFIKDQIPQKQRLIKLNTIAISQLQILVKNSKTQLLK